VNSRPISGSSGGFCWFLFALRHFCEMQAATLRLMSRVLGLGLVEEGRPAPAPVISERLDPFRRARVGGALQKLGHEPGPRILGLTREDLRARPTVADNGIGDTMPLRVPAMR
jgi:hypothetical protein